MKIDLVVPYVDFTDIEWQKLAKQNGLETIDTIRFRGQGDFFKYFFRGVAKNLSWINNLFLIVQSESQVPKWIDKTKLKVVLHEDFIPKEYLPVYSSCTIEMFLHKIPNLSENFLYFNDDMYVLKELQPESFFKDNKVRLHFYKSFYIEGLFRKHVENGYNLIFGDYNGLLPSHSVKPLLKSKIEECYNLYEKEILDSISKLRTNKNFNVYIYSYYLLKKDLCIDSNINFKYTNDSGYNTFLMFKSAEILCINDTKEESNIYEDEKLNKWFNDRFKEKSIYELEGQIEMRKKHFRHIKWIDKNRILISNHSDMKNAKTLICPRVKFDCPHIYIKNGIHHFVDYPKEYTFEKNVELTDLCTLPQIELFISDISNFKSIAEIGARYGSSSKWILERKNKDTNYDIYELNPNFIDIIKNRLKGFNDYNLYQGDASETLKTNNTIYDLVFFDCSHIYDIDIKVFESLIPHINNETIIIFDDYYLDDIKKLVKVAKQELPNNVIIYEQNGGNQ